MSEDIRSEENTPYGIQGMVSAETWFVNVTEDNGRGQKETHSYLIWYTDSGQKPMRLMCLTRENASPAAPSDKFRKDFLAYRSRNGEVLPEPGTRMYPTEEIAPTPETHINDNVELALGLEEAS